MKQICYILLIILHCFFILEADIHISGKVVNRNNKPIADAVISLSGQKELSSITDESGNFLISSEAAITKFNKTRHTPPRVILTGSKLVISFFTEVKHGDISIYSINGRRILFQTFESQKSDKHILNLPLTSAGHYLLIMNFDQETYQNRFTYFADNCYLFSNLKTGPKAITPLAKKMESIDTLITFKSGYDTTKTPITSYNEENITIILDSINNNTKKGLTIYFVRHAETVANASGQQGGGGPAEDHDSLTELGQKQVSKLTEFLLEENIVPDLIAVSPTVRTQKTIEPFLEEMDLKGQIWVELNECCGDEPSGTPLPTQRPESRWKMPVTKISDNFIFATEEDEYYWWPSSYEEGLFMVMTARDRILDNFSQSGKSVMIIGHAVNGGILLGLLRGYDMLHNEPERPAYLMNSAVNLLTQDTLTGDFTLKQNIHTPPYK
ncbi:MAG: T9SS type A sorting domain-containing protein [Fibrobacter sp.]|nr:T9SS type A sorting domain-containing protein [Fibrobacter sp.]